MWRAAVLRCDFRGKRHWYLLSTEPLSGVEGEERRDEAGGGRGGGSEKDGGRRRKGEEAAPNGVRCKQSSDQKLSWQQLIIRSVQKNLVVDCGVTVLFFCLAHIPIHGVRSRGR